MLTAYQKNYLDGHRAGRRGETPTQWIDVVWWTGYMAGRRVLAKPNETCENRKVDYENT